MNNSIRNFLRIINSLPLSKKISMVFVVLLVITGFAFMFFLANQENYQVLFSNLSPEDEGAIILDLKGKNIPYQVDAKGRLVFKGGTGDLESPALNTSHLDYKKQIESQIKEDVQSMLERIVGPDKAIVRVNAEIDAGKIMRLSVAAVIDGIYESEKLDDGTTKRKYIPRTEQELKLFEEIVKKAMGYNEDRKDQVAVSSISFSEVARVDSEISMGPDKTDLILKIMKDYRKVIINLFLVAMVFIFIVRPLLNSMKTIAKNTLLTNEAPFSVFGEYSQLTELNGMNRKNKVLKVTIDNPEKAQRLIKRWIREQE